MGDEEGNGAGDDGLQLHGDRGLPNFLEVGKVLPTRCLRFQGPDIDPYRQCAVGLDVAKVMTKLSGLIGEGPSRAAASAQDETFP